MAGGFTTRMPYIFRIYAENDLYTRGATKSLFSQMRIKTFESRDKATRTEGKSQCRTMREQLES